MGYGGFVVTSSSVHSFAITLHVALLRGEIKQRKGKKSQRRIKLQQKVEDELSCKEDSPLGNESVPNS